MRASSRLVAAPPIGAHHSDAGRAGVVSGKWPVDLRAGALLPYSRKLRRVGDNFLACGCSATMRVLHAGGGRLPRGYYRIGTNYVCVREVAAAHPTTPTERKLDKLRLRKMCRRVASILRGERGQLSGGQRSPGRIPR